MARPRKTGLDYFPKDVDFWDDYKIIDLLNEYGPLGVCIYDVILCQVYKNGYYLEVPIDKLASKIIRIIGNRWIKEKNLVLQVILYCADIGLFDHALLSQSVITSVGIQRRYSEVTVRNKVNKDKYWLLEKNNPQAVCQSVPSNSVFASETLVSATKTSVNAAVIPQSKVKESKVNKSKVKRKPQSEHIIILPCKSGDYAVTKEQLEQLRHIYNYIDVMQALRKMYDFLKAHPESQRTSDTMDNYIEMWLSDDNKKALAEKEEAEKKKSNVSYDISAFKKYDIFE